jgi:very-short-patch-repair endonuclease
VVREQRISREKLVAARQLRVEMTPSERVLWAAIRRRQAGGHRFRRQQIVAGFILDFYCHAAALAVEVDGAVHQDQVGHDEARDEILLARGIRVLRVTNNDVEGNLSAVLARIRSALVALCPRPRTGKQ